MKTSTQLIESNKLLPPINSVETEGKIDKKKFSEIYGKFYKPLTKYSYYRVSDFDLAEEISQETFLKTWIYINSSEKEIKDIKNFLYKVAKNLIIDFYKQKKQIILRIEDLAPAEITERPKLNELIDKKIQYEFVLKLIKKMDIKYKKILLYRFADQLEIDDICDKTKMSPNHVSVMIYKGLKILKKQLLQINHLKH